MRRIIIFILMLILTIHQIQNPTFTTITYGRSMEPLIHSGQEIKIKEINDDGELKINDIILFENKDGEKILHRIKYIGEDIKGWYVFTKGDNNHFQDNDLRIEVGNLNFIVPSKVRLENILGKVIGGIN